MDPCSVPGLDASQIAAIRHSARALLPGCASFLASLIKVDTTNPPGRHYPECAALIGDKLVSLGFDVQYIDVPPESYGELAPLGEGLPRRNVAARLGGKGDKTLHVNGHFDVVPAGTLSTWKHDPFGAELENGRMYGRGSSDMKSGIAAQIFAVEAVQRAGFKLKGSIEQSGVVDEETTGVRNAGMGFLVEQGFFAPERKIDAVIITEPLGVNNICFAHRGTLWGTYTFYGRAAHGSMPSLGRNALHHACAFVHLANTTLGPKLAARRDPTVIPPSAQVASLAFTVLNSGSNVNTIPDVASVQFNRRLVYPETIEEARKELRDVLEGMKAMEEFEDMRWEYEESYQTDPAIAPSDAPIVGVLQSAIGLVTGKDAGWVTTPGSDDQRFLVNTLKPPIKATYIYGPGNLSVIHTSDESIDIENELGKGLEVLALTFASFLGLEDA
ncbi:acetylornithine deacetylase [Coniophora puteana RWD-64-598 SS2]|uniref:Acetylornithine deacetylase n=1 Tax=Coniophora puteana (strain RWD-64-598) TaxID=741705 RepID=A0A5M3MSF1_CONPW|nr:acetylornithine deacetylase [Coniophora puteana RWD-64-598 SS2]EIW81595.1 acetylornithine deacetylase [Coniophora puteana RWD-64-598 SS2]